LLHILPGAMHFRHVSFNFHKKGIHKRAFLFCSLKRCEDGSEEHV